MTRKKKTRKEKQVTAYPIFSHWSQWTRWMSFIALLLFLLLFYLTYNELETKLYWQIGDVIVQVLCIALVLLASISLFAMKSYEISESNIVIRNYFHKHIQTIPRKNVDSFYEIIAKNKHGKTTGKKLTLNVGSQKIKLNSNYFTNYSELKTELTKGLEEDKVAVNRNLTQWGYGIGGTFILVSSLVLYNQWTGIKNKSLISKSDMPSVTGIIESYKLATYRNKHSTSHSLNIKLNKHNEFTFKMAENLWGSETLKLIADDLQIGDEIGIWIEQEEYQKKISQETSLNFWDKHNQYYVIQFYGLYSTKAVLPIEYYIDSQNKPKDFWDYVFIIFMVVVLFLGLFIIYLAITISKPDDSETQKS